MTFQSGRRAGKITKNKPGTGFALLFKKYLYDCEKLVFDNSGIGRHQRLCG
jgi:hypothetical protein